MTGSATMILKYQAAAPVAGETARHRARMGKQLAGAYPFTLERSVTTCRLNKFLPDRVIPAHREALLRDAEAALVPAGLSEEE